MYYAIIKVFRRAIRLIKRISHAETTCRRLAHRIIVLHVGSNKAVGNAIIIHARVASSESTARNKSRETRRHALARSRHRQLYDVEARTLGSAGIRHLVLLLSHPDGMIVEPANIVVTVVLGSGEIECSTMHGIVVVAFKELFCRQSLQSHICHTEVTRQAVGLSRHRLIPYLPHHSHIFIVVAEVVVEPIGLVAHPFVRESIVGTVTEQRIALAEHFRRIGIGSLPLSRLLPYTLSVAAAQMEACIHRR